MESLTVWNGSLANRSESAKFQYTHYFQRFAEWTGKTPDELRELKWQEDQSSKPWERNQVENLARKYLGSIEEQYSCSTQKAVLNAIRSFFSANGLKLNLTRNDRPVGCAKGSRVPKREEIKTIVDNTESLRNRALILFLKDSGLRQSDVAKLKWRDLKDYDDGFFGVEIETKKKGILARAFIGAETSRILFLYKEKRIQGTEKIAPENNIEEHAIFALYDNPKKTLKPRLMSWEVLRSIPSGIEGLSAHGLRKFWEQNSHYEHEAYQKQMNGRALTEVEKAYFWKETDELLQMYKNNYDQLRIQERGISQNLFEAQMQNKDRRIQQLENELLELRGNLIELRNMIKEIASKQG